MTSQLRAFLRATILATLLTLSLVPQVTRHAEAATPPPTVTVNVCGTVTSYTAATVLLPGAVTISGLPYTIAANTVLQGSALLLVGANVCLNGNVDASGLLSNGTVTANAGATATVHVCGTVSAYTAAGVLTPGTIIIGGQTFAISPNTTLAGTVTVNTPGCLDANLSPTGSITAGGLTSGSGGPTVNINVCGTLVSYTAATASAPGSININGLPYTIAANTILQGSALLTTGANVCLNANVDASGLIHSGTASASAGVTASVHVCGTVTAYSAAGVLTPGSITIGGQTFAINPNTTLAGTVTLNTPGCLDANLSPTGSITAGGLTSGSGGPTVNTTVCGTLVSYTAATASAPGSININGLPYTIAVNTLLQGSEVLTTGANVCLNANVDASGLIHSGTASASAGVTATVHICGTVTAYSAAGVLTPGSITIGGQTFAINPNTTLTGTVTVNTPGCLDANLSPTGSITAGGLTSGGPTVNTTVCGTLVSYTAATASAPGSININGLPYTIAANTILQGSALLTTGANVCLNANVDASGLIHSGTASANAGATATVHICGTVSAYTAAGLATPGSITIGGQTFAINPNTTLTGTVTVNTPGCLDANLSPTGSITGGGLTSGGPTVNMNVCGTLVSYTAATASAPGNININGLPYTIAAGTVLQGNALLIAGASVCLNANVDASGVIHSGTASANVGGTATAHVCGTVSAYTQASTLTQGSITVAGQTFTIDRNVTFTGAVTVNTPECLDANLSPTGTVTSGGVTSGGPTYARVTSAHVDRTHSEITVRWHVSQSAALAGFNVYLQHGSAKERLNRALIVSHPGMMSYRVAMGRAASHHLWLESVARDGAHWWQPVR